MTSEELAWRIRRHVLEMTHNAHSSHIGSALSVADIVAVIYNDFVDVEKLRRHEKNRPRIVLSKGHAGTAVYAALTEKGLIPVEKLETYCANGSRLSGHVSKDVTGIEVSTGSLGQGIGMAIGMALAGKKDGLDYRTFVIVGDGECDEGSVWEGVLFARQMKLNNLTVIVDCNNLQGMGRTDEILDLGDLAEKFAAFGWSTRTVDGHDHEQLKDALTFTDASKPYCVIANTVKGKGISFMENNNVWHYRDPQGVDYDNAVTELARCRP